MLGNVMAPHEVRDRIFTVTLRIRGFKLLILKVGQIQVMPMSRLYLQTWVAEME